MNKCLTKPIKMATTRVMTFDPINLHIHWYNISQCITLWPFDHVSYSPKAWPFDLLTQQAQYKA